MDRRRALRLLGTAGAAISVGGLAAPSSFGQGRSRTAVLGSGPTVIAFDRPPAGYFDALSARYRVVVMNYPPDDMPAAAAEGFTVDRVCADILAVADDVGAARFAWYGFSWGAVVGLQLAIRTTRLTALACGGWPPLGGQYDAALAAAEMAPAPRPYATFYRSLRGWREREAVSALTCPRLVFAGTNDQFTAAGHRVRIGPLVAEHRGELERLGWSVRMVEGFGHELGARPDVITPILREFFDARLKPDA